MPTKSNCKTDMDHEDELGRMVCRLYGLECAIENSINGDNWGSGVHQLIQDIIEKMEKCAADFEKLRLAALAGGALSAEGSAAKASDKVAAKGPRDGKNSSGLSAESSAAKASSKAENSQQAA